MRAVKPRNESRRRVIVGGSEGCARLLVLFRGSSDPPVGERGFLKATLAWMDEKSRLVGRAGQVVVRDVHTRLIDGSTVTLTTPWTGQRLNIGLDGEFMMVTGFGDRPELRISDLDGTPIRMIRWDAVEEPITREDRMAYEAKRRVVIERIISEYGDAAGFGDAFPGIEELGDVPSHRPVFDGVLVTPTGEIWVRQFPSNALGPLDAYAPEPVRKPEIWTVFSQTGVWLGSVSMPPGFELMTTGAGRVFGAIVDEWDSLALAAFELVR